MIRKLLDGWTKTPAQPTHCEYWVFTPNAKLPPQELLLSRLLRSNPFDAQEPKALGPQHGLLFSDIRLSMSLVLREKNVHLFRPDLFERHIAASSAMMTALSESAALVRARFTSEVLVPDRHYLRLMPFLAEALAYYSKSDVIFDLPSERLFEPAELRSALAADPHAERSDVQLHTVWLPMDDDGMGATRGLVKVGLPELQTPLSPDSERTTVCGVLNLAADALWNEGAMREEVPVEFMGGNFLVRTERPRKGPVIAHVLRVHGA